MRDLLMSSGRKLVRRDLCCHSAERTVRIGDILDELSGCLIFSKAVPVSSRMRLPDSITQCERRSDNARPGAPEAPVPALGRGGCSAWASQWRCLSRWTRGWPGRPTWMRCPRRCSPAASPTSGGGRRARPCAPPPRRRGLRARLICCWMAWRRLTRRGYRVTPVSSAQYLSRWSWILRSRAAGCAVRGFW